MSFKDTHIRLRKDQIEKLYKILPERERAEWIRDAIDKELKRYLRGPLRSLKAHRTRNEEGPLSIPFLREYLENKNETTGCKVDVVRYGDTEYTRKLRVRFKEPKGRHFFVQLPSKLVRDWDLRKGMKIKILRSYYHLHYNSWGLLLLFPKRSKDQK
jgi:hypothetical protein